MKKTFLSLFIAGAITAGFASCGSDDKNEPTVNPDEEQSYDLDYNSTNATGWHNYMSAVANLLRQDAISLYDAWNTSYDGGEAFAVRFKNHSGAYSSAWNCIEEILGGCADIATEVGEAKIGDPYNLYRQGNVQEALYAVESWYSWHSRDDYANNIRSIRNSYYGSTDDKVHARSISALVKSLDPALDSKMTSAIDDAQKAILAIPQPFRNNIAGAESSAAMEACAHLENVISNDLTVFLNSLAEDATHDYYDTEFDAIVDNYVDNVVLPTYKLLVERNTALQAAVNRLTANPTNSNFEAACSAWLDAREPWEESEAFLFGPVDALGLDPNMDSWPLDVDAITNHINAGNFDDLTWGDGDNDETVEAAQSIRGFHTLEFLLFKNGNPRTVN